MKTIALIAHDQKKEEMLEFVGNHLDTLKQFHLVATRTTGTLINARRRPANRRYGGNGKS